MADVSLCMIVKNEADYLPRFFSAHKGLFQEIIVVDTGSEDESQKICKQNGAKVFEYIWDDDFAAARNFGLEQAGGEWAFILDPDELILSDSFDTIAEQSDHAEIDAYKIDTRNYTKGYESVIGWRRNDGAAPDFSEYLGYFVTTKTRMVRLGRGYHFKGCIHELLDYSLTEQDAVIVHSPLIIHHPSPNTPEKMEYYLKLLYKKRKDFHDKPKVWFELGNQLKDLGRFNEALGYYQKVFEIHPESEEVALDIIACYGESGRFAQAIDFAESCKERFKESSTFISMYGTALARSGRYAEGASYLKQALAAEPDRLDIINNLGLAAIKQDKAYEAVQYYIKALSLDPNFKPALINLSNLINIE